jgi:hypothetical protein
MLVQYAVLLSPNKPPSHIGSSSSDEVLAPIVISSKKIRSQTLVVAVKYRVLKNGMRTVT